MRQPVISGKETTIPLWSFPKYRYELVFDFIRQGELVGAATAYTEYQTVIGFINSVSGDGYPFYYNDPNDNTISSQTIGVGDGGTTDFQLLRAMGGFVEPIQSPNTTAPATITVGGSATTQFSYLPAGIIRFNSPPANGAQIVWSGSYYWLARFDDSSPWTLAEFMNGFFETKRLSFTTVKL